MNSLFCGFAVFVLSNAVMAMGPALPPTTESKKIMQSLSKCQQAAQELKKCDQDGKKIPNACKSSASPGGGGGSGTNPALRGNSTTQGGASAIASGVAASCRAATTACETSCEQAAQKAQQCLQTTDKEGKAKEAAEEMKKYCTREGGSRADAAQQQANANQQAQDDSKDKEGKSSGGSPQGGAPQMPQKPQEEKKPEEKKEKEEKECKPGEEGCAATADCAKDIMAPGCQIPGMTPPILKGVDEPDGGRAIPDAVPATFSPDITPP